MNYQIICDPTFTAVEVDLAAGESVVAEAGAMAWMSENIRTETSSRGGIMAGLKRAVLTRESFFQNTYTAEDVPGHVTFAPGVAGDIVAHEMEEGPLVMEAGSYLASTPTVKLDSNWQGLKGLLGEGLFALYATGATGTLLFSAYGAVYSVEVDGDYVVDNGYAVAWEPSLQYHLTRARKIRSFLFADQLLMRFEGRGRLWVQSRSPQPFANWVHPFRPVKSKSN